MDDILEVLPPEVRPDVALPADDERGETVVPLPDPLDALLPEIEAPVEASPR